MYLYYGDVTILEKHYDGMKHYVDFLSSQRDKEGLIIENHLGEWVPPSATEIAPSLVSSAYYYYDLTLIAQIANIVGQKTDADSFMKIAEETKKSFNQRYYNPEESTYSIGRQGRGS